MRARNRAIGGVGHAAGDHLTAQRRDDTRHQDICTEPHGSISVRPHHQGIVGITVDATPHENHILSGSRRGFVRMKLERAVEVTHRDIGQVGTLA